MYWKFAPAFLPAPSVRYEPYLPMRASGSNLAEQLLKAVNGEYSAIACYEQLARLAPNETERERILEIRTDEVRHYQLFAAAYARLTGKQPSPQLTEPCPDVYMAGLQFAFKDEQETVDFYLDLAEQVPEPFLKEQIRRAAADEQNHAVWFLYLCMRNMMGNMGM